MQSGHSRKWGRSRKGFSLFQEKGMYRVVIIENALAEARYLQGLLERYGKEKGVQWNVSVYLSAHAFWAEYNAAVDLVLLDVELPDVDGIELSRRLRRLDAKVMIMFVTHMVQYAIQGYEVEAQDFILKPVQYEEFALRLEKALHRLRNRIESYFVLSCHGVIRRLDLNDLYYVNVVGRLVVYHMEDRAIQVHGSLKNTERQLEWKGFARCSHRCLVNLCYVREIRRREVILTDGETLRISRGKRNTFLLALADYYGGASVGRSKRDRQNAL